MRVLSVEIARETYEAHSKRALPSRPDRAMKWKRNTRKVELDASLPRATATRARVRTRACVCACAVAGSVCVCVCGVAAV